MITKNTLLATNLEKLKALLSVSLNKTVTNIEGDFNAAFPESGLLVTQAAVDGKAAELKSSTIANFKTACDGYDSQATPKDYVQVLESAFASKKEALLARVAEAWASWATKASYAQSQKLSDGLQKLGKDTAVGDTNKYTSNQADLLSRATLEFNQKIDTDFHGLDGDTRKKDFASYAESLCKTSRAVWEKNDADVITQLKSLVQKLESLYQIQLQDSLTPHVEPAPYAQITNASVFKVSSRLPLTHHLVHRSLLHLLPKEKSLYTNRFNLQDQLTTFLQHNNVLSQVGDQQTLEFDLFVSSQKSSFNSTYAAGKLNRIFFPPSARSDEPGAVTAYQSYLLEQMQEENQRRMQAAMEAQALAQGSLEAAMHRRRPPHGAN